MPRLSVVRCPSSRTLSVWYVCSINRVQKNENLNHACKHCLTSVFLMRACLARSACESFCAVTDAPPRLSHLQRRLNGITEITKAFSKASYLVPRRSVCNPNLVPSPYSPHNAYKNPGPCFHTEKTRAQPRAHVSSLNVRAPRQQVFWSCLSQAR